MTIRYTATFADGFLLSRNSKRTYSHAWRLVCADGAVPHTGFAATADGAEKSGRALLRYYKGSRVEVAPAVAAVK